MPASVYPDATTRATASAIAKAKNVAFDMSDQQPAAFGATVGQGEWGLFQDFLRNPSERERDPEEARVVGGGGLQEGQVASHEPGQHRGGAARSAAAPPARLGARPAPLRRPARSSCCPRSCCSASGSSTRPSTRSSAASTGASGFDDFVGIDNYKALFTTSTLTTAIKNNLIWVAVVPAFVTAIGLIFAVLTERVELGGRVQDGRLPADGDLRLRDRRHVADHVRPGSEPRRRQRARPVAAWTSSTRRAALPTRCRRRPTLTGSAHRAGWC